MFHFSMASSGFGCTIHLIPEVPVTACWRKTSSHKTWYQEKYCCYFPEWHIRNNGQVSLSLWDLRRLCKIPLANAHRPESKANVLHKNLIKLSQSEWRALTSVQTRTGFAYVVPKIVFQCHTVIDYALPWKFKLHWFCPEWLGMSLTLVSNECDWQNPMFAKLKVASTL